MTLSNPCLTCPLQLQPLACPDGTGPARLVFHGEAPGEQEAKHGLAFVGPAGQLLRTALAHHGFQPNEYVIMNAVLCRPPDNRVPTTAERTHCQSYHQELLLEIAPQVIVIMGNTALQTLTGRDKIMSHRGTPFQHHGQWMFPMLHPSACLHNPKLKPLFEQDFVTLKQWLTTLPPWTVPPRPAQSPIHVPGGRALAQKIAAVTHLVTHNMAADQQTQTVALLHQLDSLQQRCWDRYRRDGAENPTHGMYPTPPL